MKSGTYQNDISYVLSWDRDTVDILVAPQEHPYDNDILFDVGTAQLAGCATTVEQLDDLHTGVVTCHGCSYHQGLHANHSQSRC